MRFEGRFASRLVTAFRPLIESPDPALRLRAARDELAFMSSALDIAVGSAPEVDLLDMVTLVSLGRDAMARRWSFDTCGEAARAVGEAFQTSLDDVATVARAVTSGPVEDELRQVIREWQVENPDQDDVTGVRLSAYARYRDGTSANAAGLFAVLRGAAETDRSDHGRDTIDFPRLRFSVIAGELSKCPYDTQALLEVKGQKPSPMPLTNLRESGFCRKLAPIADTQLRLMRGAEAIHCEQE